MKGNDMTTLLVMPLLAEEDNYGECKISNGYGMLAKAGATVQKGAKVHLTVDFTMKSVATQDFKTWLDKQKDYFSDEQWHTLEENYAAGGFLGGVLSGAFGMLFGAGDYNHYKNQHDKEVKVDNKDHEGFVKSLHDVTRTTVHVKGTVDIEGVSMQPTSACVFVQTTTISFKDGSSLTVVDSSDPVAATEDGDVTKVKTSDSNLSVVDLPHG